VSSSQDFGVEQFFRADEFRADDPSPLAHQQNFIGFFLLSLFYLIVGSLIYDYCLDGRDHGGGIHK
jgi:hypothetical protein